MLKTSIIHRRDLEPLWVRATEVVQHYERAVNCSTAVVGLDGFFVSRSREANPPYFCILCKRFYHAAWKLAPDEYPCTAMHIESARDSRKCGGSCVYTCSLGFYFWTSPFFSFVCFAGALMSSGGVVANSKQSVLDKIFNAYKGEISRAEISQYLDSIPERDKEDINALVQMMMLCAEQISCRNSSLNNSPENGGTQSGTDYMANFLEQERSLIAGLRRGDNMEAGNIMRALLYDLSTAVNGNLDSFKLRVMEVIVMLSRTGATPQNNDELVEANNRFLKRIESSKTIEEVSGSVRLIMEQMAGKIFSFQGIRHASALRKAERFIWENYSRKISLKEIADISGLSAPYFSTIFKDEMGENLSNYLNRLRVEKASTMLRETDSPISGISVACGFEDQSWFSKVFKCYTGFSPSKYREHGG
jgi:AraC-like DNA-binding protein/ligand-binding sensor protein